MRFMCLFVILPCVCSTCAVKGKSNTVEQRVCPPRRLKSPSSPCSSRCWMCACVCVRVRLGSCFSPETLADQWYTLCVGGICYHVPTPSYMFFFKSYLMLLALVDSDMGSDQHLIASRPTRLTEEEEEEKRKILSVGWLERK